MSQLGSTASPSFPPLPHTPLIRTISHFGLGINYLDSFNVFGLLLQRFLPFCPPAPPLLRAFYDFQFLFQLSFCHPSSQLLVLLLLHFFFGGFLWAKAVKFCCEIKIMCPLSPPDVDDPLLLLLLRQCTHQAGSINESLCICMC